MSGDIFRCHAGGEHYWHQVVEVRGAAEHPAMQTTASATQSYPAQNGNTAPGEKLWVRGNW